MDPARRQPLIDHALRKAEEGLLNRGLPDALASELPPEAPAPRFEPPTYIFRVRILGGGYAPENCREIWREFELAGNQTLLELGEAIPDAFGFDDPHLWCFFLSGRRSDVKSAYALDPLDESYGRPAEALGVSETPPRKEFLYLFDFGDQWEFGVRRVRTTSAVEPGARYPRVVAQQGEAPPQYPDFDDWDETDEAD